MYAIITQQKISNAKSFNGRISHNERRFSSSNINRKLTPNNITITKSKYNNFNHFINEKKRELKKSNAKNGTKNRFIRKMKNVQSGEMEYQSTCQEFVISSSPNFDKTKSVEYLKKADIFFKKRFKNCEIISSEIHLDETTPHLHIIISYFDINKKKWIQKELSKAKITDFDRIRNDFQKEVADEFGLKKQDGAVVKKGTHQQKASLEVAELKATIKNLNTSISKFEAEIEKYEERVKFLSSEKYTNATNTRKIKAEYEELISESTGTKLKKEIAELKNSNENLKNSVNFAQDELEDTQTLKDELDLEKSEKNAIQGKLDDLRTELSETKNELNELKAKTDEDAEDNIQRM